MTANTVMHRKRIAWKVLRLGLDMASVRYRALLPALALQVHGYESTFIQQGESLTDYSSFAAAIFVKSFSPEDLELAKAFVASGVPVFLDLCDNVFVDGYGSGIKTAAFSCFEQIAAIAAAVVTPTCELASQLRPVVAAAIPILVIPDQVETELTIRRIANLTSAFGNGRRKVIPRRLCSLPRPIVRPLVPLMRGLGRLLIEAPLLGPVTVLLFGRREKVTLPIGSKLARDLEKENLSNQPERRRIVWFGNHGAPHSGFGLNSLAEIVPKLADVNRAIPLELIVISNNRGRFDELFSDTPFPVEYREWGPVSIFADLRSADVCVLPNPRDSFSIAKSANRAILSLSIGIPVVATSIPSLEDFKQCTIFDDWVGGLMTYLSDANRAARDVAIGRKIIAAKFAPRAIGRAWNRIIEGSGFGSRIDALGQSQLESPPPHQDILSTVQAPDLADRRNCHRPILSVVMCTYNGERFLHEQLDSLAHQTKLPDELVVCDDGSTDGTADLLEEFRKGAPFQVRLIHNQKNRGVLANFEQALKLCGGQYIALADQDDVWHSDKLDSMLTVFNAIEGNRGSEKPLLLHTDLRIIDSCGQKLDDSFFQRRRFHGVHPDPIRELVMQNYVTGCATMVNRALVCMALPIPSAAVMHDWWLALVAAATGDVVTLKRVTMDYRLHSSNQIGPKKIDWISYLNPADARFQFQRARLQSIALEERLRELQPNCKTIHVLTRYHNLLAKGGLTGARDIVREKIRFQSPVATMSLVFHVAARSLAAPQPNSLAGHSA
jgi:glycosyltransferase involved in cell wall biosynthesis